MKKFLTLLVLLIGSSLAHGATVFISQSGGSVSCGADGTQTTVSVATYNSSTPAPDDVDKTCGTITSQVTIGGSGTSGHPITFSMEAGSAFSKPSWGNVNILAFNNRDWITVDCGGTGVASNNTFVSQGLFENTNVNSTNNTTIDTGAIAGQPTNNSIVKNCLVQNLFVKTVNDNVGHGDAIHLWGNNNRITNNVVHDSLLGPTIDYLNTQTGGEIDHNLIYNCNQGIISADRSASSSSTGMTIHDNLIRDWANWDNPVPNQFHHNGIFIEVNQDTAFISGLLIYYNTFTGDTGVFMTGEVFLDAEGNGTNGSYAGAAIFSNLFIDTSLLNEPSNGLIITKANGGSPATSIYNNTQVYPDRTSSSIVSITATNPTGTLVTTVPLNISIGAKFVISGTTNFNGTFNALTINNATNTYTFTHTTAATENAGTAVGFHSGRCVMNQGAVLTLKNNTVSNCSLFVFLSSGTAPTSDYNNQYQSEGTDTSEGIHSITVNPLLNVDYTLQSASPLAGAGLNLSGLGITQLNTDKAGIARGSSWAIGAFQPTTINTPGATCKKCNLLF